MTTEHLTRDAGTWELVQAAHKLRALSTSLAEIQHHVQTGRDHLLGQAEVRECVRLLDHGITRLAYAADACPSCNPELRAIRELCRDAAGPLRQLL